MTVTGAPICPKFIYFLMFVQIITIIVSFPYNVYKYFFKNNEEEEETSIPLASVIIFSSLVIIEEIIKFPYKAYKYIINLIKK